MELVLLVIHIILALAIIGVILIQPPENSSLGGLGSSNAMGGGVRGQGNILTRATAILVTLFIMTSLTLAIIAGHAPKKASILGTEESAAAETAPTEAPVEKAPPSVPLTK